MVPINYLAVVAAAVASMAIGFVWYGPLFGKQWMALMGFTKESMNAAKAKGMSKSYALMTIGSLVMAYVLANGLVFGNSYLNMYGVSAGLQGAFWYWLGFVAPVLLGLVLWDGKPWKLFFLNAGYYLVSMLAMGAILAGWM